MLNPLYYYLEIVDNYISYLSSKINKLHNALSLTYTRIRLQLIHFLCRMAINNNNKKNNTKTIGWQTRNMIFIILPTKFLEVIT